VDGRKNGLLYTKTSNPACRVRLLVTQVRAFYFLLGDLLAEPVFVRSRGHFQLPVRPGRSNQVFAHLGHECRVLGLCLLQRLLERSVLCLLGLLLSRPSAPPLYLLKAHRRFHGSSRGEVALHELAHGGADGKGVSFHVHFVAQGWTACVLWVPSCKTVWPPFANSCVFEVK